MWKIVIGVISHSSCSWTQDEHSKLFLRSDSFWPILFMFIYNYISATICSDGSLRPASCRQTGCRALRRFAWCMSLKSQVVTKMSAGTSCSRMSWRSESLYFVLTIDYRVHCKMSSQGEQSGNPSCLCTSVSTVHILFLTSSGLSVNHYVEKNVSITMLVRFKPEVEIEKLCTVRKEKKKKNVLLRTKALSVWQIKTYLWKRRVCFVFFRCLISYSVYCFSIKDDISIRDVFFAPIPHSVNHVPHLCTCHLSWWAERSTSSGLRLSCQPLVRLSSTAERNIRRRKLTILTFYLNFVFVF